MRLIDADALEERMNRQYEYLVEKNSEYDLYTTGYGDAVCEAEDAPTIEAIQIDTVAEMLAELFGEECCCNYNGIDEWLPMLCEHSETCPGTIEKNGCWKQFIKHWEERKCENAQTD